MLVHGCFKPYRSPHWAHRVGDTLIVLAFVGVVWLVFAWNMLHWSLKYCDWGKS